MDYQQFIETKKNRFESDGFEPVDTNPMLFDYQVDFVKVGIRKGRFAYFLDCGLGKTIMQFEIARQMHIVKGAKTIILTGLAIVKQMHREACKFGYDEMIGGPLSITNYENINNVDFSQYECLILDESSILKNVTGKTANALIEISKQMPYRYAFTATPSPNDHMELGMHSEFVGAMSYLEMLAMYFVHDGGQTSKWRLRKHAEDEFWRYVSTWSVSMDRPSTLGYDMCGFDLPGISYIEHKIHVPANDGELFSGAAVSATELHRDLKQTQGERVAMTADIVNSSTEQWIVWTLSNDEAITLTKSIDGAVNVTGSDSAECKANALNDFAQGATKCIVTKTRIAGFGMNFQNAHSMVFTSYDFKFEAFYQAVRREYRFGQKEHVNVHLMVPESQYNVRASIERKQAQHQDRIHSMSMFSRDNDYSVKKQSKFKVNMKHIKTDNYELYNGDCVQEIQKVSDNAADIVVFSPPFAELYVYSDKAEDMGNVKDYKEFERHFEYLIPELSRVLKDGRICAVHCMDLPIQKGKEGFIGLRDFSGMLVDMFTRNGFIYHSRVTIWKNPVTEMQRTKALGLLHKQIKKDSVMSRVGIPDYVLFFRNSGENDTPIVHQDKDVSARDYLPVDLWQKYASPVWYDVDYSRTLQYTTARDSNDEKHIAPLQIDTVERILHLYSNEGETVFSPFGGIGTEGVTAIKNGRKSISIELKESYFAINSKNHNQAVNEARQKTLF